MSVFYEFLGLQNSVATSLGNWFLTYWDDDVSSASVFMDTSALEDGTSTSTWNIRNKLSNDTATHYV